MTSSRLSPSIGPDHDFPSLGISVDHPLYFPNDRLGTLLRNAQNPRRIERRCRPAVVDSDRLPHVVIIRRQHGAPGASPQDFVIPSRAENPVRNLRLADTVTTRVGAGDSPAQPAPRAPPSRNLGAPRPEGHDFSRAASPNKSRILAVRLRHYQWSTSRIVLPSAGKA